MIRGFAPINWPAGGGAGCRRWRMRRPTSTRASPASQIFSSACAECHKAPHGLAKGKSAATVAEFLREHYTTNREQAAALAA